MNNKKSKKGFTLMEMLIVVAIIAILIAIAIPAFSSSLVKAKKSADEANLRSAYADLTVDMMTEGTAPSPSSIKMQSAKGTVLTVQGANTTSVALTKDAQTVEISVDTNGVATYKLK